MSEQFEAYVLQEQGNPAVRTTLTEADLPEGEVTVDVAYSSLNYKDGLALTGKAKIARSVPMVLGIDLAGTVRESNSPDFQPGDQVLVTGSGLSETMPGGFTERQRLRADVVVRLPEGLSAEQAMGIGTAGFTAMLCLLKLERAGVRADSGPVLVTGAGGGVGNVAIALLAENGYEVVAATGRPELHDELTELGASSFVDRAELAEATKRPLESEKYAGAIDTVGGVPLAQVLKQIKHGGAVAACGNAAGVELPASVLPFILRDVSLLGVDSVHCPRPLRLEAWDRLTRDLKAEKLAKIASTHSFDELPQLAEDVLAGRVRGRVAIRIGG